MPELTGSLSSFNLAPLLRFVGALGKSGDLVLSHGHWTGHLALDQGQLVAAVVEHEQGDSALDFISLVLRDGYFEFSEGPPRLSPNLGACPDPLLEIDERATRQPAWLAQIPGPSTVPRIVNLTNDHDDSEVLVPREAVSVFGQVDGHRTVRELAVEHGLLRVVSSLATLHQLNLVEFGSAEVASRSRMVSRSPAAPPLAAAPKTRERAAPFQRFLAGRILAERVLPIIRSDHVQAVFATAVLVLLLRSVVQNFRVQGVSMQPSFNAGQVLVVNRAAYFHVDTTSPAAFVARSRQGSTGYVFDGPRHGDVAVFTAPPQPDTDYIKRIIGLPGDTVLVRDGRVFVNGAALNEPYVHFPADYAFPEGGIPLVVPDAQYFVLGDNRPESFDSHAGWLVPVNDLIGRAWIRYWPPDVLGMVAPGSVAIANTKPS